MKKRSNCSSGVLIYQYDQKKDISIFLVHPGGPFWSSKQNGAWSIPKGEIDCEEDEEKEGDDCIKLTAVRELFEETNLQIRKSDLKIDLGKIKQNKSKTVFAFAYENTSSWSEKEFKCNSFTEIDYPPHSGKKLTIPEVDQGKFFTIEECKTYMNEKQFGFIDRLLTALNNK